MFSKKMFFAILCFVFLLQKSKSLPRQYFNGVQLLLMPLIDLLNVDFSGVSIYSSQLSSELSSDLPDSISVTEFSSEDVLSC